MRTTIDLPDDLLREAKILAVQRRSSLRDLVAAGLRHELSRGMSAPLDLPLPAIHLPASAPVLTMTPADFSAALHQEETLDDSASAG